jgi:rare lipoprotein A
MPAVGAEETGTASWYGHPYHGRPTASGEVYDMNELTAAHRTLPLGSRLMVTNLDNAQAVEVRVNDRGPFAEGRILDLSYAAARVLGADRSGVIPVRLRVLVLPGGPGLAPAAASGGAGYTVQVGAFTSRARADSLRESIARDAEPATVSEAGVGGETFYRVRVGSYADREAAEAGARRLAARGYRAVVVER